MNYFNLLKFSILILNENKVCFMDSLVENPFTDCLNSLKVNC
ncbi:hypothetical protein J3D55_003453 [Chryseobacterium ginsenosidimutans]|nr:hypothetical protein [Chryseobacterium ginsenosidimutans]